MPFRNESRHLPATLRSLASASFSRARLYVIGIDNGSDDGSDVIFERWLLENEIPGELVREPVPSIPHSLNVGIRHAALEDVIVRLDAHTVYGPGYLGAIDDAFATLPTDVWCVGGAPNPDLAATDFQTSLGIALYSNPLGLGPADFRRDAKAATEVSTVYLGAWRPGVLQRLGGFDERWLANEDCEFTERIRSLGGRIYRIPLESGRIVTRDAWSTVRQWTRYGFWRMQTFKRYPKAVRPRHVAVPLGLIFGVALVLARAWGVLATLYAAYAVATIVNRRPGEPARATAGSLVFFPCVHVGYALGLLVGLARTPASLRAGDANHSGFAT